jgi:hypothetical protein
LSTSFPQLRGLDAQSETKRAGCEGAERAVFRLFEVAETQAITYRIGQGSTSYALRHEARRRSGGAFP